MASGAFQESDRFHLINGFLVEKTTQNPPHGIADELCGRELERVVPLDRCHIRAAKPIRLSARASEPEPDRCVVRGSIRDYEDWHPGPEDVMLFVEIADSSLAQDRRLAAEVNGPSGIPTYWIVNLVEREVEVYSDPVPTGYASCVTYGATQVVPVVIDGRTLGEIHVDAILPSRPARSATE